MSRIDELIAEFCPGGVEVKRLVDISRIKTGQSVSKASIQQNPGPYPVINSGREPLGYLDEYNTVDDPVGVTSRGAGVGSITWCEGKYYRGNLNYSVTIRDRAEVEVRFLYHLLLQLQAKVQELATYQGIPALNKASLEKLLVPVPPLEVQREIVRILDKFTQLEAELEAELEARRIQYEYYLRSLLSFSKSETWMTLGDLGKVSMCKRVFKSETNSEGGIPFYKIGTFGGTSDAYITSELYEEYRANYPFPSKGQILISAAGTIGRAIVYNGEPAYFQDSNIVWIDNDESLVTNAYLRYWYRVVEWSTDGGTIQRLYNENLRRTKIPVPSLEVQTRIVSILDKFDALANSISIGLPAELNARRQQYEYYRDKLLTFAEIVV
jgi:type I restriction enzyme S subunit